MKVCEANANAVRQIAFLAALFLVAGCSVQDKDMDKAIRKLVADLERIDRELPVGESVVITIRSVENADVVILPAFEHRANLQREISDKNLIDEIHRIASTDQAAPAILWLKDGAVVGSRRLNVKVRIDLELMYLASEQDLARIAVDKVAVEHGQGDALRFRQARNTEDSK